MDRRIAITIAEILRRSDDSILKYDASAPLAEYQLFISLYLNKNNPNKDLLLHAFSKLMEADLYGLGI